MWWDNIQYNGVKHVEVVWTYSTYKHNATSFQRQAIFLYTLKPKTMCDATQPQLFASFSHNKWCKQSWKCVWGGAGEWSPRSSRGDEFPPQNLVDFDLLFMKWPVNAMHVSWECSGIFQICGPQLESPSKYPQTRCKLNNVVDWYFYIKKKTNAHTDRFWHYVCCHRSSYYFGGKHILG